MFRSQIIAITISVVVVVVVLFRLPKSIINKTNKDKLTDKERIQPVSPSLINKINKSVSEKDFNTISRLRKKFYEIADVKKRIIFADSLATVFVVLEKYDSAARYADVLVLLHPEKPSLILAGNIYYQLYSSVQEPTVANRFAAKAQEYYYKVLETDPDNKEVKNNLAMTYVTSDNPMQAISLLREVLAKDPNNETSLFNLGLLSIQSGQYDRAVERFRKLIEINRSNWKAHLYLGIALNESGKASDAAQEFELVAKNAKDPVLVADAKEQLGQKN